MLRLQGAWGLIEERGWERGEGACASRFKGLGKHFQSWCTRKVHRMLLAQRQEAEPGGGRDVKVEDSFWE